jgi:ABC-type protease/lipase transport system fused ATPase/permease subunit
LAVLIKHVLILPKTTVYSDETIKRPTSNNTYTLSKISVVRTGQSRNGAGMLEFNNVSKSFWTGTQRKVILEQVSFRVELGNSLGILAPMAQGKPLLSI